MSVTMVAVIGYGLWKTRGSQNIEGYLLGGNEAKWWTVGLSVMATQASAITFLSTPGQAYFSGMEFIQFYFTLPIALIIICVTFIPIFYKLKVYTAYEFLENRFDYKTRALTSFLFLIQRGLATGITILAPALILSSIMGWNLNITTLFIGTIAILYTVSGGTKAVHVTHKLQMIIILIGLIIIFFILVNLLGEYNSWDEIMTIAGNSDKLKIIDTEFEWNDKYNIYTCLIAAPFLFLSYFGTDQSQVQRYISGKSVEESRKGLLMNAMLKLPLQFFILFLGVLVFVFYQTNKSPIFFNQKVIEKVMDSQYQQDAKNIISTYDINHKEKLALSKQLDAQNSQKEWSTLLNTEHELREDFKKIISKVDKTIETNDKDYVFISFIINNLPKGLIGLLFAMVFFAAMSSTASELNALGSTTTIDIYKRLIRKEGSDRHYLVAGKMLTLFWGVVAILFASFGRLFENLIQFVNIVGSIFYGTILGIFLVAFYIKKVKGNSVFIGALLAQCIVFYVYYYYVYLNDSLGYLWLNLIGTVAVIVFAYLLELIKGRNNRVAT
jgi:SSS family transporter